MTFKLVIATVLSVEWLVEALAAWPVTVIGLTVTDEESVVALIKVVISVTEVTSVVLPDIAVVVDAVFAVVIDGTMVVFDSVVPLLKVDVTFGCPVVFKDNAVPLDTVSVFADAVVTVKSAVGFNDIFAVEEWSALLLGDAVVTILASVVGDEDSTVELVLFFTVVGLNCVAVLASTVVVVRLVDVLEDAGEEADDCVVVLVSTVVVVRLADVLGDVDDGVVVVNELADIVVAVISVLVLGGIDGVVVEGCGGVARELVIGSVRTVTRNEENKIAIRRGAC